MRKQQRFLQLSKEHHSYLTTILAKGLLKAQVARRASGLLQLHQGSNLKDIAESLGVAAQTIADWRDKYFANGLDFLVDKKRTGRPIIFDGVERAKITALACSQAPAGRTTWTLRLLADKAVEFRLCESLSHQQVKVILKKMN